MVMSMDVVVVLNGDGFGPLGGLFGGFTVGVGIDLGPSALVSDVRTSGGDWCFGGLSYVGIGIDTCESLRTFV